MSDQGLKHDQEKTDLSLLPLEPLMDIAKVFEFGAEKYARDNWRKGHKQTRLIAACLRHILAYNEGETNDPESGLPHLAHAGCCIMFALYGLKHFSELDDRWKAPTGVVEDTQEDDKWIKWNPIDLEPGLPTGLRSNDLVIVQFRGGNISEPTKAGDFWWGRHRHADQPHEIVAYGVLSKPNNEA